MEREVRELRMASGRGERRGGGRVHLKGEAVGRSGQGAEAPRRGSVRRRTRVARGLASVGRLPSGFHWSARQRKKEKGENGKIPVD